MAKDKRNIYRNLCEPLKKELILFMIKVKELI